MPNMLLQIASYIYFDFEVLRFYVVSFIQYFLYSIRKCRHLKITKGSADVLIKNFRNRRKEARN